MVYNVNKIGHTGPRSDATQWVGLKSKCIGQGKIIQPDALL